MIKVGGVTHHDLTDCGCFHPQRRHLQHFPYFGCVWDARGVISDWRANLPPRPTPDKSVYLLQGKSEGKIQIINKIKHNFIIKMLESVKKSRGKKGKCLRWMRNSSQFLCRLRPSSLASSQVALDKAGGPSRSEWEEPARKRSASNQPHQWKSTRGAQRFRKRINLLASSGKKTVQDQLAGWMDDGWVDGGMDL